MSVPTMVGTATAARVVEAVKVYGAGGAAVRALDAVTVDFPAGGFTAVMGSSGSGKCDPAALRGRPGHADLGSGRTSGRPNWASWGTGS